MTTADVRPIHTLERPEIRRTTLLQQALIITRRNLIHIKRMPEMLMDVTIQPVMFVLLFAFVFGSSIAIPIEGGYKAFLLAGIMAQTVAFSSFIVAVGLTADLDKGIVDRMRSLPINPAAPVTKIRIAPPAAQIMGKRRPYDKAAARKARRCLPSSDHFGQA